MGIAAVLGYFAKYLRQPIILGYLATGFLIARLDVFGIEEHEFFNLFASMGIMFLLFLVGLEINFDSLKSVGAVALAVGLGQVAFTALFGFLIGVGLGFKTVSALYIAIALTFSSTIIIVKLLSEKKDMSSLYGKISVGMMLVQDLVAIVLLVVLTGLNGNEDRSVSLSVFITLMKGLGLFFLAVWLGRRYVSRLFDIIARSRELLFVFSLAWVFVLVIVADKMGFSIEMAGFLAGIALANSAENHQISNHIRSLKDFFLAIFFVILGSSLASVSLSGITLPLVIFSLFVLIGNPFIVMVIMGIMGYRSRTGFLTGVTVAQISEFSLVLMAMGYRLGHVSSQEVSLVTAVGILTITMSTYMIIYSGAIFERISKILVFFERKKNKEFSLPDATYHKKIIVIGGHRTGSSLINGLPIKDVLVIDFDPDVIEELKNKGIACILGDVSDPEILEIANIAQSELIISTNPDLRDNLELLENLNILGERPKMILRAETERDAESLYAHGADYVLLPHFTAGQYLGKTIAIDLNMSILRSLKEHDLKILHRQHLATED